MTHKYDSEIAPLIEFIPELDITDIVAARQTLVAMAAEQPPFEVPPGVRIDRCYVDGADGAPDVPVIVFRPTEEATSGAGLLWIHGGGFVLGDAEGDQALPAQFVAELGTTVVSVDYRLAPEHPFPAGIDDCYSALTWFAESADEFGIDRGRIAVGGMSSGGGMAAGLALLARDRGGPALCFQLLDIPEVDHRLATVSVRAYTDTPLWTHGNAIKSWEYYLGESAVEVSPYASPSIATDLTGLPPAYVSVCEFDPLRDEGISYAQSLVQAGIPTELHLFPGTFHGSGGVSLAVAAVSQRMRGELVDALRRGVRPANVAAMN